MSIKPPNLIHLVFGNVIRQILKNMKKIRMQVALMTIYCLNKNMVSPVTANTAVFTSCSCLQCADWLFYNNVHKNFTGFGDQHQQLYKDTYY